MLCEALGLAGACLLQELRGHSAPYFVGTDFCALQHQRPGGNYRPFAYVGVVEHGCTHAYQRSAAYRAGVHGCVVAYAHVVLYLHGARRVGDVYARAVLHVDAVAYVDVRHVTADHRVEPHRALVAHIDLANNRGVLAEVAVLAPCGRKSVDCLYQCHKQSFLSLFTSAKLTIYCERSHVCREMFLPFAAYGLAICRKTPCKRASFTRRKMPFCFISRHVRFAYSCHREWRLVAHLTSKNKCFAYGFYRSWA